MVTRKRTRAQAEQSRNDDPVASEHVQPAEGQGLLLRLRNMWEFAALVQYIYSFGKYMKIPAEYDIDLLETESLKPGYSSKLQDLGLILLKFVSSHRGLTPANFDEYTRRQYLAKSPLHNPFGDDEEPCKFNDLDIFTRIRVLYQLTLWTSWNPDRFRAQMPEQKENQQISWRIEEFGYDSQDRYYYVLDDNRLYRRTSPSIAMSQSRKPKANSKRGRALARAAKKRKLTAASAAETQPDNDGVSEDQGYLWECVAITLGQYQTFLDSIQKSSDPDEQLLRERLLEHVIPIIEKQEESQQRKIKQKERELLNMERMAHAKRSSRIAMKQEQERLKAEMEEGRRAQEAEREKQAQQQEMQKKLENERRQRLLTREKRLRDRESRRKEREKEIARVAEEANQLESGEKRMSERRLKAEIEKRKKAIEELREEDGWIFDCSGCGVYGENHDDGSHTISCEKCNVWQHSQCLGIRQEEAEDEAFHYVCADCKRRIEEANRPKIPPLRFHIGTSSPPERKSVDGEHNHPLTSPLKLRVGSSAGLQMSLTKPQPVSPANPFQASATARNHPNGSPTSAAPSARSGKSPQLPVSSRPPISQHAPSNWYSPSVVPAVTSNDDGALRRLSTSRYAAGLLPPPIDNAPAISPTQGNRDVGPLAGFSGPAHSNMSSPATPHGMPPWQTNMPAPRLPSSAASRSATSPSAHPLGDVASFVSPLMYQAKMGNSTTILPSANTHDRPITSPSRSSHPTNSPMNGVLYSGLSPTKHSPMNHPPSSTYNNHPIFPPVRELRPSPKLMGRSSPDEPIPPPVKPAKHDQLSPTSLEAQQHNALRDSSATTISPTASSTARANGNGSVLATPQVNRTVALPAHSASPLLNPSTSSALGSLPIPQPQAESTPVRDERDHSHMQQYHDRTENHLS